MRIVVTAGPTRECIDAVRFISNPSSGKMGFAVAREAVRRGHKVLLLTGPTALVVPAGVSARHFESAEDLYRLVKKALPKADCLIMAAAPGDYRPARKIRGKHKKQPVFTLQLVATRDVLASVAPLKDDRIFVGFAVEAKNTVENARKKVLAKSLDFIVLNSPASFGADEAEFSLVYPSGRARNLGRVPKKVVAAGILDEVESLFSGEKLPHIR